MKVVCNPIVERQNFGGIFSCPLSQTAETFQARPLGLPPPRWPQGRTAGAPDLRLGKALTIFMLKDYGDCYNEDFAGFSLTKFDGTTIGV